MKLKKLPVGIQTFEKIRTNDYIYVDKTEKIFDLIENNTVCFLSRPRRFGKSLLVSTLQDLFEGKKELFKGLWIYDKWEWTKENTNPVLQFSLASVDTTSPDSIRRSIIFLLDLNYERHRFKRESEDIKVIFNELIQKVLKKYKQKVVILIDEYDKPVLDYIYKKDLDEVRDILRQFYGVLKDQEKNTRFLLLTGISKFSKLSVFSELNNLKDVSQYERYSQMLGLTQKELERDFKEHLAWVAQKHNFSKAELLKQVKFWYNGYSFDGVNRVYNPFSFLNFASEGEFRNYWIESGSPAFLIKYIKSHKIKGEDFFNKPVSIDFTTKREIENALPESFLYQAGYLTLSSKYLRMYYLNFPNMEVKSSFNELVLISEYYFEKKKDEVVNEIILGFEDDNFERVFEAIKVMYANIPHKLFEKKEKFYHSLLLTMLWASGVEVIAEDYSNLGNSDLVILYKDNVYVVEIKLDKTAKSALKQIKERKYYEKWMMESGFKKSKKSKIYLIGMKADSKKRNLVDYIQEEV